MALIDTYNDLVTAIDDTYGVATIKQAPFNLRTEVSLPGASLGWVFSKETPDVFAENSFPPSFQFAYAATDEEGLLSALDLIPTLVDAFPTGAHLTEITRMRNITESKALDYVILATIEIGE